MAYRQLRWSEPCPGGGAGLSLGKGGSPYTVYIQLLIYCFYTVEDKGSSDSGHFQRLP